MTPTENVIDVLSLCKSFGPKAVVIDLTMQVKRGSIFGFLGPNGSGKTTSIRMMCGLLTPDKGEGHTLGYDIRKDSLEIKRHVGYMTQKFSFYEDLSIRENLDFIARIYQMQDRKKVVNEALERLGLAARKNQLAGSLSGGWKQRMALAACMLHNPQLLLLDEPTAGVDPKARRDFWDEIHALAAEGITILVSTHYMDEAERCHRLAYIAYGRLLAQGTPDELVKNARLATWTVEGTDLTQLTHKIRALPGAEQVVPFGNILHISGRNEKLLNESLLPLQNISGFEWRRSQPKLEDVFIQLMQQSQDNFQ